MRIVIFGASGMVGQAALRACLADDAVSEVLAVVRAPLEPEHPRLRQIVHRDFTDYTDVREHFEGIDACLFCLGVSSAGRSEADYTRVTYDYTLAAARALLAASPELTFVYVSGEGTDANGRRMWARVKGRTENDLLAMDMTAYMFRPGYIQPVDGATSKTPLYRVMYRLAAPLYPVLKRVIPRHVTTSTAVGRAMLAAIRLDGAGPAVLENPDINRLAAAAPPQP